MRPVRFGVRCCTFTVRCIVIAPARMAYRSVKRSVDFARELHEACAARLSDRSIDKAAKAFGKQNTIEVGAWQ